MSATDQFKEYVLDLLDSLDDVSSGKFFGGVGLKSGSKQFAMIMGNTLYFCVNDATRKKYEEQGMEPFSYSTKKGRVYVRKYYSAPEELLEDREQLIRWAEEAIDAAFSYS